MTVQALNVRRVNGMGRLELHTEKYDCFPDYALYVASTAVAARPKTHLHNHKQLKS